jgi:tetratricopeptide (TPR) repeat protein
MILMAAEDQKEERYRLGRHIVVILGILGGLSGILMAALQMAMWLIGGTSSHIPGGWSVMGLAGGVVFLLLGLAGIAGAALYSKEKSKADMLLLCSGLLGFPVGYLAWAALGGFIGWTIWTLPGALLMAAGFLAWATPERVRSHLPGQGSRPEETGALGHFLFAGVVLAGTGLIIAIMLVSGIMVFGAEEGIKSDQSRDEEDFSNADMAASMGRWDVAVRSYDDILARNQSNVKAWQKKGYALWLLGRYNESLDSYKKAYALNPGDRQLQEQLDQTRLTVHLINALNDSNASVRADAALALGKVEEKATEPLVLALKDENSSVRANAAAALGDAGDWRDVDPLAQALNDTDASVRARSAEALGKLGYSSAKGPLIMALNDSNSSVRENAALSLERIG